MPHMSMLKLPLELQDKIFQFLSIEDLRKVSFACQSLRRLLEPRLWRHIHIELGDPEDEVGKCKSHGAAWRSHFFREECYYCDSTVEVRRHEGKLRRFLDIGPAQFKHVEILTLTFDGRPYPFGEQDFVASLFDGNTSKLTDEQLRHWQLLIRLLYTVLPENCVNVRLVRLRRLHIESRLLAGSLRKDHTQDVIKLFTRSFPRARFDVYYGLDFKITPFNGQAGNYFQIRTLFLAQAVENPSAMIDFFLNGVKLPNVEHLTVHSRYHYFAAQDSLQTFFNSCKKLKKLELYGLCSLDLSWDWVPNTVTNLYLYSSCHFSMPVWPPRGDMTNLLNVKELGLGGDGFEWPYINAEFPSLNSLVIRGLDKGFSNAGLEEFLQRTHIRQLKWRGFSYDQLLSVLQFCPYIEHLDASGTSYTLFPSAEDGPDFSKFPRNLKSMAFETMHSPVIIRDLVSSLAKNNPELDEVVVNSALVDKVCVEFSLTRPKCSCGYTLYRTEFPIELVK